MHSNKERSTAPHSIHLMGFSMHGLLRYILYLYTYCYENRYALCLTTQTRTDRRKTGYYTQEQSP